MRLGTLFAVTTIILVALVGTLLSRVLLVEWTSYRSTEEGLRAMELAHQTMVVAEKLSAERGPANGVLGDSDLADPSKRERLRLARVASDTAINDLQVALGGIKTGPARLAVNDIHRATAVLAAARQEVDRVSALPRRERDTLQLMGAVGQMFDVIPEVMRTVSLLTKQATGLHPQVSDAVVAAYLTSELREYAGRLGSLFTAVLTEQRPLNDKERRNIIFLRGRIEQLHEQIRLRIVRTEGDPRIFSALRTMEDDYFQSGLNFIDAVERAGTSGAYGLDTAAFAARYVPLMTSISHARDDLVRLALESARAKHAEAAGVLAAAAAIGCAAFMLIGALFMLIRKRVVQPLIVTTQSIVAIAQGQLDAAIPVAREGDEIGDMVAAVNKLKATSLAKQSLESERRGLVEELRRSSEDLKRSNAELEQFAYAASHDMREPLRMIASYLSLLERRLGDGLDGDCREFLAFARDGARRLDQMILGLLDYSRVGRGSEPWQGVRLSEVVEEVVESLHLQIEKAGGTILMNGHLPELRGLRWELVRLFQNLISNALKYADPGRAPVVTVSTRQDAAAWQITVADNGSGIPLDQREAVFGLFQRNHGAEIEGCGIGLATCRKIVEYHGGRIWVDGDEGHGSSFHVLLPAAAG